MPRYRPETEKAKAIQLTKSYRKNNFNQTRLAEQEGVTSQAINQRLKRTIVKKTFAEMMDRAGLTDTYLRKKMKEGLEATKVVGFLNNKIDGVQKVSDEFVEVKDMHCRHKYLVTALEAKNIIKHTNGNGKGGVSALIINISNRTGLCSEAETKIISSVGK